MSDIVGKAAVGMLVGSLVMAFAAGAVETAAVRLLGFLAAVGALAVGLILLNIYRSDER